jgi:nucleotide-binding universal stress UspA family protein
MHATRNDIRPYVFPAALGSPPTHTPAGPIIVCVDMSAASRRAAFETAHTAEVTDAPVHFVVAVNRVWSQTVTGGGTEAWNINWLTTAEQFLDELIRELPNRNVTRAVIVGATPKAVRAEAARLNARRVIVCSRRAFGPFRGHAAVPVSGDALL